MMEVQGALEEVKGQDDAAVKQEHETPEPGLVLAQEPPKTEPSDVDASMTLVEVGEREYSLIASKLLIGSWLLKGANPHATSEAEKSLFNIEVSTNGAQRIKYEITQPGASLMIDYEISSISGVTFKTDPNTMIVELSEPPSFSAKEEGKWIKVLDFTQCNASHYRRHHIEFYGSVTPYMNILFQRDDAIRQLADVGLPEVPTEPSFAPAIATMVCDWDKENIALLHCVECGTQNYCAECDEVLHRHPDKRHHKRIPTHQLVHNNPNRLKRKKKKQKSERCRCGTGATKGTLGDPCTGNRCPCYSDGKGCSSCGCKNCKNPHNDDEKRMRYDDDSEY